MKKNADVLLVNPPETGDKRELTVLGLPLGILYLASFLEKKGKSVKIFDSILNRKNLQIEEAGNKVKIGASWEEIKDEIARTKPKVVGITNHFSSQIKNALRVAEIVKEVNKKIITVIGGPHASCNPEDFLERDYVDFVVKGEGEFAFNDLIDNLNKKHRIKKIPNIAYREGEKNFVNPLEQIQNLDEIPFPAYHLINMENYFEIIESGKGRITIGTKNKRRISMITSRGCPFDCIFCSIHGHMGRRWRAHSGEYILKHIEYLVKNFGVNHISFEDDNLILDKNRFKEILDGLKKRKIKITWDTPNGIRADILSFDLLKKMKNTGCSSIKIGVESGNQEVLNKIVGKNLKLEKVIESAKSCKKLNIPLTGFFIIGLPGETKENIQSTLNFARMLKKKYKMDSLITISMPLKGTKMYALCEEKKYLVEGINPSEFGGENNLIIETENFDMNYLTEERRKFYKDMVLLQILQVLKKPSLFFRYASVLKSPKKSLDILRYLIKKNE